MKYIKTFENLFAKNTKSFFKLKLPVSKLEFETILWKLGESPEKHNVFIDKVVKITNPYQNRYLFVSLNIDDETKNTKISYMPGNEKGFNFYKDNDYKYLGEININKNDIKRYEAEYKNW